MQVITCMVMTIAFASNSARTSLGLFAIMLRIYSTESVTLRAPIPLWLHVLGAIGLCLGTLLCSFRLVPVTGMLVACCCLSCRYKEKE